jgi:DNA-binding NarL/FixJ family response regulator
MKKRIGIVEDNRDLREALAMMIQFTDDFELSRSYPNAEAAIEEIPHTKTDAVLMDINLPGSSGIECVAYLKRQNPDLLFLMCTSFEDDERIFKSLEAGASGYILKTDGPMRIIFALQDLFDGGSPMSGSINSTHAGVIGPVNTAIGVNTQGMYNGSGNIAMGFFALGASWANHNTAVGHQALEMNQTGANNVGIGAFSLQSD